MTTLETPAHEHHIDSRVALHDRNHFEVKLDYASPPDAKDSSYRVDTYFFVPASFGLNASTYPKESFYNDVQSYIRLKTPSMPLRSMLEPGNERSPLLAIERLVEQIVRSNDSSPDTRRALVTEMKLLACIVRSNVRQRIYEINTGVESLSGDASDHAVIVDDLEKRATKLIKRLERVVARYRKLRPDILTSSSPDAVAETYRAVDEYVSWIIEWGATELVRTIDAHPELGEPFTKARARATARIIEERIYRRGAGYSTQSSALDSGDEHFLYRTGLLKKFVMSVLWLDVSKSKDGTMITDVGAAIAAGAAMLFAILVAIAHAQWLVMNSAGFVFAAVATYILKDRIKEWLKRVLSQKMGRWVADYDLSIKDPSNGAVIGRCREAFAYLSRAKIPQEIRDVRMHGTDRWIEDREKPEVVFKYEKNIRLAHGAMQGRLHQEHHAISDIIRFDVARLLLRTDDPVSMEPRYSAEADRVEVVSFSKVYHVNIVLVLTTAGADRPLAIRRVRVVLDKKGIVRVEEPSVPVGTAVSAEVARATLVRSPTALLQR